MTATTIHLGYEVGTGEPVAIPLRNLAVTGQTQESGKTSSLEALCTRSGSSALVFITKRGERCFQDGHRVTPYFRDRADWQFVDQLLEAQLREKNKFLRPWIIRICRTTRTLADVHREVRKALEKAKGVNEGVYTQLDAYLDLIVPEISRVPMVRGVELRPGLNVMDLAGYQTPMQMLFVQSAIDWVNEHCRDTIVVVPEAWEFVPESRGSPVKASAIALVRKGSGIGNRIWVDSQDMAGVDKTILRGCPVWLIGVQRESNEVKRNLANIPANIKRPKPADVMGLELGQFYACWSTHTVKAYVQPAWLDNEDARRIALGEAPIDRPAKQEPPEGDMSAAIENKLDQLLDFMARGQQAQAAVDRALVNNTSAGAAGPIDEEGLYQRFKARLAKEAPALVKVLVHEPEINVEIERVTITADGTTAYGLLARLIAQGYFDEQKSATAAWKEMQRLGFKGISARVYEQLPKLTEQGFLTKEGKDGYRAVKGMKVNIVKK
jgi:hypothetical protein